MQVQPVDFDLRICPNVDAFDVYASSSLGYEARARVQTPIKWLLSCQEAVQDGFPSAESAPKVACNAARCFGGELFERFFRNGITEIFFLSLGAARERGEMLRIRLHLAEIGSDLEALYWEYLYWRLKDEFFATSPGISIVRYLEVAERYAAPSLKPPLRILVASWSPRNLIRLRLEKHLNALREGLLPLERDGLAVILALERPGFEALREAIKDQRLDVLHMVGHGHFDTGSGGSLFIEDESGQAERVSGEDLATTVQGHPNLRLITLCACESGVSSGANLFGGVAQSLVRKGVPAVVAMRAPVRESLAIALTSCLYRTLSTTGSIDAGLLDARRVLSRNGSIEWGIPALYSRMDGDLLFRFRGKPGHPLYHELLRARDWIEEGKVAHAADMLSRLELGKYLTQVTSELWKRQECLVFHRRMQQRLCPSELLRSVEAFLDDLEAAS